jgi:hypothetical protein
MTVCGLESKKGIDKHIISAFSQHSNILFCIMLMTTCFGNLTLAFPRPYFPKPMKMVPF